MSVSIEMVKEGLRFMTFEEILEYLKSITHKVEVETEGT